MASNYTTVTLDMVRGPAIQAQAIKCGRFCVHTIDGGPLRERRMTGYYTISHTATGRRVTVVKGRDNAKIVARRMNALIAGDDFTEADFSTPWSARYSAWVPAAIAIAREYNAMTLDLSHTEPRCAATSTRGGLRRTG